jgi:hypothetical protein
MLGDDHDVICDVSTFPLKDSGKSLNTFVGIGGLLTKIRTRDLSYKKQDSCRINHGFR